MLKLFKSKNTMFTLAFALLATTSSLAQTRSQVTGDNGAKQAQTLFIRSEFGSSSFDSQAAASKETRTANAHEVGGWFGESRIVGLSVRSQVDEVPFTLNDSESRSNFTDVRLKGRIWGIIPSVGVSLSDISVERAGVKTVGLFGTGLNAGLGGSGTLYPGIVLNGDLMMVKSNNVYDKLQEGSKLGDRLEADAHISFDVTDRILDLLVGYRVREYKIETASASFKEKSQGIYAGARLGVYF